MNNLKHKPNLAAQMNEHEMPEWKGKWKNMHFLTGGGTILGNLIYDSREQAAARMVASLEEVKSGECDAFGTLNGFILPEERQYTIQIPVGE